MREAAIPKLEFIDRLPVGEAIEFYLNAAEELIRTCDLRHLNPGQWEDAWYKLHANKNWRIADFRVKFGRWT